ncbi:MAG: metallophosphoesterase family protein [Clostridiales bacterium]|nr:metallophosphoesterase family protein [Clostridiales bacterium]
MRKIGIVNDVHGNLEALQAVLYAFETAGCEEIIGTGDILTLGPDSIECLRLLRSWPRFSMVSGNHERCFFGAFGPPYPSAMAVREAAHHQWVFDRLSEEDRAWLCALPPRIERRMETGLGEQTVAFVHYPMAADGAFLPNFEPSAEALDTAFEREPAAWVFYGHDHRPSDFTGRRRYINLGPMGCPGAGSEAPAGILTGTEDGLQLQKLQVPYDKSVPLRHLEEKQTPDRREVREWFYGG